MLLLFVGVQGIAQPEWKKNPVKANPVVCYASSEVHQTYVMPPSEFLHRLKSSPKQSEIIVSYVNFPDSLKSAVNYAVQIWESLIRSSVPIHFQLNWEKLDNNVLGSCGATMYYSNFENAPIKNTYYSIGLVEKITGKEQSCPVDAPDIIARFNSSVNWYFGTDGKTPANKYDFVSIALHEITHGLGFTGYFQVNTTSQTGYLANSAGYPAIFDQYVEDLNLHRLTNTTYYKNSSNALYKALTSTQLFSGSPIAYAMGSEKRPLLYAPTSFNKGSSIYHLDDFSYPPGNANSLMTPTAGSGEAIHSPGPLTEGIMDDLGWKNMLFRYDPVTVVESTGSPIPFKLSIESDLGIRANSVYLVYSYNTFQSSKDSIRLSLQDSFYAGALSPVAFPGKISYFFTATDTMGRRFTFPSQAPVKFNEINLNADTESPEVIHKNRTYVLQTEKMIGFSALISDNMGIDNVKLQCRIAGNDIPEQTFVKGDNGWYFLKLIPGNFDLLPGSTIDYSITATDISQRKNTTRFPKDASYKMNVEKIEKPLTSYSTNFDNPSEDFILSDFQITQLVDFDNPALHSVHPYASMDKDEGNLEYTAVFRFPVLVSGKGKMSFDEVVLVEPGEDESVFGCEDFYDYVIVEGSKDYGNHWLPLLNGYDSRSQNSWLSTYNQKITGNNSTSTGNKNLFINRSFSLTENGNFREGDTILIRFRLYSDPYAHGWGWAVDNLKIQDNLVQVHETALSPGYFMIWPNPAVDYFNLKINQPEMIRELETEIYDITGRLIMKDHFLNVLPGTIERIELNKIPSGMFFVTLKTNGIPVFTQKMVKN